LAASLFENSPYYEAKSAGLFPIRAGKDQTTPITQALIDWADKNICDGGRTNRSYKRQFPCRREENRKSQRARHVSNFLAIILSSKEFLKIN
jgi:hypothetical protein